MVGLTGVLKSPMDEGLRVDRRELFPLDQLAELMVLVTGKKDDWMAQRPYLPSRFDELAIWVQDFNQNIKAAEQWMFMGSTSEKEFQIHLPQSSAAGAKAWVLAFWINPRAQSGPPCEAVKARLALEGMEGIPVA